MKIKSINTNTEYKAALKAVSSYFDKEPDLGSLDAEFFEAMLSLITSYETKNFSIDLPLLVK